MRRLPERTCTGCGRKAPQPTLTRFVAIAGVLTEGRRLPGRGAYTCPTKACFEAAVERGHFARVLRTRVTSERASAPLYTEEPNG